MPEKHNTKRDLVAVALLALTAFLGASLLTYNPADPPTHLVYPEGAEITNVCGRAGALVGSLLLTAFGLAAYYLVVSLAVVAAVLLARRPVGDPLVRLVGWLLSLVGLSALGAMALPQFSPGPVVGPGGYLGLAGRALLEMNFASTGSYIIVASLILGGLLLSTDYVLFRLLAWMIWLPAKAFGRGAATMGAACRARLEARPKRRRAAVPVDDEDDEEEVEEEEEDDESSIRVKSPASAVETHDDENGEADDSGAVESSSGNGLGSLLRIRKPRKTRREEVIEQIEAAAAATGIEASDYELPAIDLLLESEPFCFDEHEQDVRRKAKILEKTFADFGFHVRVVEIQTGPVIAQFEVELEAGLRLSKITGLADDLAIALRVPSVRIVAPIPGKNTVGIEIPNAQRQLVRMREVMEEAEGVAQTMRIPVYLGKDVAGLPVVADLAALPHLLIAGRTGTGKSVCLNSIIVSILMCRRPEEVRMLMIDPKMVELSPYRNVPHLMHPVVTDMRKAEAILAWAVEKMEERYQLLARAGVRHLTVYNQLGEEELMDRIQPDDEERERIPRQMPFIVIVADEMADLMMTAAKEVEGHIIRLAQKSRAVGIHLVLATQKPTVDVITGLIKSNLPARICFEVSSRTDSRVVLDEMGGEKLLGNGDMLFLRPGTSAPIRGQGTYLSDDEIARVIDSIATSEPQFVEELVELKSGEAEPEAAALSQRDEMYEAAIDVVVREGRGSVSLLQRALGIGYGRAARLIDFMAEDGLVGPYNGSQAREVLLSFDEWEQMRGGAKPPAATPPTPRRRTNTIQISPAREVEVKEPTRTPPVRNVSSAARGEVEHDPIEDEEDDRFDEADQTEDNAPPDDEAGYQEYEDEEDWEDEDDEEDDEEEEDFDDEEDEEDLWTAESA